MEDNTLRGVDQIGQVRELTDTDRYAAMLTTCHYAADRDDAAELLAMLGLVSAGAGRLTTPCSMCLRPMSNVDGVGHVRQHAKGMCGSCYGRSQRGGAPSKQLVVAVEDIDTPVGVLVAGAQVYAKAADGGAWLLHIPGSRIPVAVGAKAVRVVEVSA
ncbi:hypothetical protein [Nocardia brasiliensis]|uniref:hypothetical protein n=1 Tax=Nocardia brasiliensis TaxID=37326 RepID=UPI003670989E